MINNDLNDGQRVVFVPEKSKNKVCEHNPVGVTGIVVINEWTGTVSVVWDNGKWNMYNRNHNDLKVV